MGKHFVAVGRIVRATQGSVFDRHPRFIPGGVVDPEHGGGESMDSVEVSGFHGALLGN
jgi:hypothetical protein